MNDNESILSELRRIGAWADMQRRITKWSLIAVAVMPALIAAASDVLPQIRRGDATAADSFRDYVAKSTEITSIQRIVGYRKEVGDTNRLASLPPGPDLPVLKSSPLASREQKALTKLLLHVQVVEAWRGEELASFELKVARKAKTISVWYYGSDLIMFRIFDDKRHEFVSPDTELTCPGIARFIEAVLNSEFPELGGHRRGGLTNGFSQ